MKNISKKILFLVIGLALLGGDAWAQDEGYIDLTPTPKKQPSVQESPACPSGWERGNSGLCQRSTARVACKPGQKMAVFNPCVCNQPLTVVDGVCVSGPVWTREP